MNTKPFFFFNFLFFFVAASVLRSVLRYGKKQFPVDENRRETYRQSLASEHEPSVLPGLEGEWNQLMAVLILRNFLYCALNVDTEMAIMQDDGEGVAIRN